MMQDLKDRADGRNVTKHLEELKNIQTGMNNMLEGIKSRIRGRRMEKWPGRKNGGNHCHRTEYRKKDEIQKRRQPKILTLYPAMYWYNHGQI